MSGCIDCSKFTGKGCKLTGIEFLDYVNVAVKPRDCPVIDEDETKECECKKKKEAL